MGNDRYEFGHHYVMLDTKVDQHLHSNNNPHKVTKGQIGLGNVDNVSVADIEKLNQDYVKASAGAYLDLVSDETTGKYTISLYSADDTKLGDSIVIDTDNEFAIKSVELDLSNKRLIFKRYNAPEFYCDISALLDDYTAAIKVETDRAVKAESALLDDYTAAIKVETDRAVKAEALLQTNINNEENARALVDGQLADRITAEISRAESEEADILAKANYANTRIDTIEGKESTWDAKQDAIIDLETIRSGAALGATALQSYTETDPIFTASEAAKITDTDIDNWNKKSDFSGSYKDLTDKPEKMDDIITAFSQLSDDQLSTLIEFAKKLTTM